MKTTQDANPLVDILRETGKLPDNQLGGETFKNNPPILPDTPGRIWYEADVGLSGSMSIAKNPGTRLVYSNDGLIYIITDHYETVHLI